MGYWDQARGIEPFMGQLALCHAWPQTASGTQSDVQRVQVWLPARVWVLPTLESQPCEHRGSPVLFIPGVPVPGPWYMLIIHSLNERM